MKQVVQNEKLGEIVYEESFWTGKKTVSVNGSQLEKFLKILSKPRTEKP